MNRTARNGQHLSGGDSIALVVDDYIETAGFHIYKFYAVVEVRGDILAALDPDIDSLYIMMRFIKSIHNTFYFLAEIRYDLLFILYHSRAIMSIEKIFSEGNAI